MMLRTHRWSAALLLALVACATDADVDTESFESGDDGVLAWVGDTHVRVGETWLPPSLQPAAGQAVTIYTQTYPIGAATSVELYWATGSYDDVRSVEMVLDADGVGTSGNNSQWRAEIPADAVRDGEPVYYWIRGEDTHGRAVYDSRDSANYELHPRRYDVGWIGGFGSYRPVNGDYIEGGLFNDDGSTSTGCWNHGVSLSSYRTRSARVWIPGLSDRDLSDAERAAVQAMVRLEVYTEATDEGWRGTPARLIRREGNDLLYEFQFATFNPGCILGLGDGTYGFKLRASTDDGASWFWRGDAHGNDLLVQYAARCSYFNDPFDCIPTETALTRSLRGGAVQAFRDTPIGATSTFTKELRGSSDTVRVTAITITGPDADQFALQVYDTSAGGYADPEGPFDLRTGDELRLILVHTPTVASPGSVLPHQATVEWDETRSSPFRTQTVSGVYLRGTTAN